MGALSNDYDNHTDSTPLSFEFLKNGGELGRLIAEYRWSDTSIGPIETWPQSLKTVVGFALHSPVPIVMLWGEDGVMLYNDAYSVFAGGRHPRILGSKVREGWPEVADFNDNVMKVGLAGGTLEYKDQELTLYRTGRAEQVWMNLDYSPVFDDAGRPAGVLAVVIETTERVAAERALRDERDRSRSVLDGMTEGFALLDREFRILDVNAEATRMDGRARAEIVGRSHWTLYPGTESMAIGALYKRAIAERVPVDLEHRFTWRDGRRMWLDMRAYPVPEGLAVFFRDVTARKKAENALQEGEERLALSEQSLRLATEAAEIGTWDLNLITDVLTWSDRTKAAFGISPGASCSMRDFHAGLHPDDRDATKAAFAAAIDPAIRATYDVEYRTIGKEDGIVRHVAAKGKGIFDEFGRCIRAVGTAIDVTERRAAEERLRALDSELERQVIERTRERGRTWQITPDLLGVINADGYFESSNPAWQVILGWSEAEIAGNVLFAFVHPDDLAATRAAWVNLARGEPLLRFENRHRTKEGGYRWLSWVAVPEGGKIYCSARDVTEQRRQAEALAYRTAERDRLWETSPDLLVVLGFDGVFKAVNPAWTTVLGLSPSELIGTRVDRLIHPDDVPLTEEALALASIDELPTTENRYRHKDGTYRWIQWKAAPTKTEIFAAGRDITADKSTAAELGLTQEALRQAQKMEAVGQLTGGIAHDFNNMLAVVIGSLDLLSRRIGASDSRAKRYVDAATEGARRAANLTQRLLVFSRQQPLKPERLDVNKLVGGMSDLLRHSLGGAVRLETAFDCAAWRTYTDPNQLENVLLNLAVNARDAMPDGGLLTIKTKNADFSACAAAPAEVPQGEYVLISVTDTGVGMSADVIIKAFDPFFTTKEVGKGTGLGLSQVYGFVKQTGGHVRISSMPGRGTTVNVYLPRLTGDEGETADVETREDLPLAENQEVLLVVEDEAVVRQLSVDALSELGYRVLQADGAAAALRILDRHPEIALLFTDVVMPEINGAKLAEEVRRKRPDLKVLFTTGYTRDALVDDGLLDASIELIGKPFTIEELAAKVRTVLDSRSPST